MEVKRTEFYSQLCDLPAWSQASYLTSLDLSFLIRTMGLLQQLSNGY